jgi:3-methyladenine DNA glycosylase/8-oxoguanine DNA glycosylase
VTEPAGSCELRVEVVPRWPLRLPPAGADGVMRARGGVLERLLHVEGRAVVVRAAQPGGQGVLIGAWGPSRGLCRLAIERMRFALGVDDDVADFHARNRDDPLIGGLVRRVPWLRPPRRPEPFEALAWAICEQLIEFTRAAAIQRRIVRRLGPSLERPVAPLRDVPSPAVLAATPPALLESLDLSPSRAVALRRVAGEVASGRIDLRAGEHERAWRRLRALPGIGHWTVECLALHGQGRMDQLPAGDLGLRKLIGRLRSGGDPRACAPEAEVREFFAPYAPWAGLAAAYALHLPAPL